MKNSKKWLLSLGSVAAIAAPIAAVVACGSKSDPKADAEQLISDYVKDSNTNRAKPLIADANKDKLPSEIQKNHFIIVQPTGDNADLKLEIASVKGDDTANKVTVIVTVSSESQPEATKGTYTVEVNGFKTQEQAKAEKLINDYVADSSNHATLTPKDTAKKPSQIQTSDIEISDLIDKYNDIQLSIKNITNRDDTDGKVTAEVEVSSKSQNKATKQTYTVDVTGFQTTTPANQTPTKGNGAG